MSASLGPPTTLQWPFHQMTTPPLHFYTVFLQFSGGIVQRSLGLPLPVSGKKTVSIEHLVPDTSPDTIPTPLFSHLNLSATFDVDTGYHST